MVYQFIKKTVHQLVSHGNYFLAFDIAHSAMSKFASSCFTGDLGKSNLMVYSRKLVSGIAPSINLLVNQWIFASES